MFWLIAAYNNSNATATAARRVTGKCKCGAEWSRVLTQTVRGTGPTPAKATREAEAFLENAFKQAPSTLPCPACGKFDDALVRKMRRQIWNVGFWLSVTWLGIAVLAAIATVLTAGERAASGPHHVDDTPVVFAFLGITAFPCALVLVLRWFRQRSFDANRNAETRRGELNDPLHQVDVIAALKSIHAEAPMELERTTSLFAALCAGGGWTVDAALAEALRRCISETALPPSLPGKLRDLKRYGETPAVDAWLGIAPLR